MLKMMKTDFRKLAFVFSFFALSAAGTPISEKFEIRLEGEYPGHLQDVWCDRVKERIYWVHTDVLLMTDLNGRILKRADVGEHHAGIEMRNGRLYIAWCTKASLKGGQAEQDSCVTVAEYDAETLERIALHKTTLKDRSGSLTMMEDGTFLVGCLRPLDVAASQVKFHHLDRNFSLIKTYVIDDVPVRLGIETMKRRNGFTYLHVYNLDSANKRLGYDTVKLDRNFKVVWRGIMGGDRGYFEDDGCAWSGRSELLPGAEKKWVSRLVRRPLGCAER